MDFWSSLPIGQAFRWFKNTLLKGGFFLVLTEYLLKASESLSVSVELCSHKERILEQKILVLGFKKGREGTTETIVTWVYIILY